MRDSLDVAADEARALRLLLPAQRANLRDTALSRHDVTDYRRTHHVEVVAHETVAADGAPVARGGERAEDTRAREEGQVEAVLRVPPRRCTSVARGSAEALRAGSFVYSPQPALVARRSAHQSHVKPTHCAIRASMGPRASVDHPHTTGTTPKARRRYLTERRLFRRDER